MFSSQGLRLKLGLTEALSLPKDIVMNLPLIFITGNSELSIENFKGVIEYTDSRVRINTTCGILKIEGKSLSLKRISSEGLTLAGLIVKVEFLL